MYNFPKWEFENLILYIFQLLWITSCFTNRSPKKIRILLQSLHHTELIWHSWWGLWSLLWSSSRLLSSLWRLSSPIGGGDQIPILNILLRIIIGQVRIKSWLYDYYIIKTFESKLIHISISCCIRSDFHKVEILSHFNDHNAFEPFWENSGKVNSHELWW